MIKRLAPFFVISLAFGLLNVFWHPHLPLVSNSDIPSESGFFSRLAGAGQIITFYMYKALLPWSLSFIYPRWEIDPLSFFNWVPILAIAGTLVFAAKKSESKGLFLFLVYVIATLLPVLGFFNVDYMRYSWVADHYFYLTLGGVIAAGLSFLSSKTGSFSTIAVSVCLLSVVYSCLSAVRAEDFSDSYKLWTDTLNKNPDAWIAHFELGLAHASRKEIQQAVWQFQEVLRIRPDYWMARNDLGLALAARGRSNEAVAQFEEGLKVKPDSASLHFNLANELAAQGKYEKSFPHYYEALKIKPQYWQAHNNFGLALVGVGYAKEAILHYQEALRIRPDYAEAENNLGAALATIGKTEDAISHYVAALRIKPDLVQAHANLANAYLLIDNQGGALKENETAVMLKRALASVPLSKHGPQETR